MARMTDEEGVEHLVGKLAAVHAAATAAFYLERKIRTLLHQLKWYRNREKGLMRQVELLRGQLAEARKDTARLEWYENLAFAQKGESALQRYLGLCRTTERMRLRDAIDAAAGEEATWLT